MPQNKQAFVNAIVQSLGAGQPNRRPLIAMRGIRKSYYIGQPNELEILHGIDLTVWPGEFVAIVGESGSGKSTLMNIIGVLDKPTSGEYTLDGVDIHKADDDELAGIRNNKIGFVFQTYNLIGRQSALKNVELPMLYAGIPGGERTRRAKEWLDRVGMAERMKHQPNELSGGQKQRVAIARAMVNEPALILADEPTGALDSDTSIQVMELLKEVAKDRLVVMVTHNPELAEQYATRIVRLRDGVIQSDTAPFAPDDSAQVPPVHKNLGHSSMSPLTALALSFNNLLTKKTRTLLTAFAGSIGIIGIALILSLSAGVSNYIQEMERSTLSEYPLQISTTGVDLAALLDPGSYTSAVANNTNVGATSASSTPEGMVTVRELLSQLTEDNSSVNDLASLKKYLDSDECTISELSLIHI